MHFLAAAVEALGLKDVECLHGRAEEAARQSALRERFDIAASRAVARLPVLAEYLLPFVRIGGTAIALKGLHSEEEAKESERAVKILGGRAIESIPLARPFGQACSSRHKKGEAYAESVSAQGRQAGERTIALSCR